MEIKVGILTAPHIEYEQRENTFVLKNVRIGIGFHWDRYEDQEFQGKLEIKANPDGTETAINTIDLEDYLCSVISSEMSANSPMELLKAHAVISRSWAIRAMQKPNHEGFHVCADDHCQRYEGLRRMRQSCPDGAKNERAVEAVRATAGQVLMYGDEVCDCRYYKCCGGKTEVWRTCWEDIDVPYIRSVRCDWCGKAASLPFREGAGLGSFLNNYDQETTDFHDWKVTYTADELSEIIRTKSGIDFGQITDLIPLQRGASGRICKLKIVGTKRTEIIGKELKIRLWLSKTCLYSSWFDVEKSFSSPARGGREGLFHLTGHGWGHGAGLCQIGAAQMAAEGHSYEEILHFYYHGTRLSAAAQ